MQHLEKEARLPNIGFAKWQVQCLNDSLVQSSSSVFQLNICAENPPLRKAENLYLQPLTTACNLKNKDRNNLTNDNIQI